MAVLAENYEEDGLPRGVDRKSDELCHYSIFSILVSGKSYGMIHPSRGIRQGDPLSLYLFLLCAGFTALLAKTELERRIRGMSICRGAPRVTNLLFVDDSSLFC